MKPAYQSLEEKFDSLNALTGDLRLRLQGSQAQETAAKAEARRLARELTLTRRLLRFSVSSFPPAARRLKAAAEIPRRRAVLLTDEITYHLDTCEKRGDHTLIAGWAFRPVSEWDGHIATVTLLLSHDATTYAVVAEQMLRLDVAAHYALLGEEANGGARGLDGIGFACEIINDSLPQGIDLEIVLRLECTGLACEQSTGKCLRF